MYKFCTKCNYIGKDSYNKSDLIWSVVAVCCGTFLIIYNFESHSFLLALYIVIFAGGLYGLISYLLKLDTCPSCKNKNSMIPVDTPQAQATIKELNLTIPEDAFTPSSSKSSQ